MTLWILGDQLNHAAVRQISPRRVLLVEAYELGRTPPMHPQKLVLFFSAMRHFAQELREDGREVIYLQAETLAEQACPFNSLYWDFMAQHRALLEGNPRLGVLYKSWDKRSPIEQKALRHQAQTLRQQIAQGEV